MLLVTAKRGTVDDAGGRRRGERPHDQAGGRAPGRAGVSYWSVGSPPPLRSTDGRQALVLGVLARRTKTRCTTPPEKLSPRYSGDHGAITVRVGGFAEVFRQVNEQIESDLAARRAHRVPDHAALAGARVRQRRRRRPAAARRRARDRRHVPRAARSSPSLTDVSIFALNLTTAHGARARDRLQPLHRLALPRGAPRRARRRTTRSSARSQTAGRTVVVQRAHRRGRARRAARLPARVPAVVRLRRHRAWRCSPASARSSPARRCSAVLGTEGQLAAVCCAGTRSRSARASGTGSPRS